jgi:hypothetical protein
LFFKKTPMTEGGCGFVLARVGDQPSGCTSIN